ncbi:MAG TPA: ABC transporter permease, partial [Actinomycetota bacterium]|nr:ABC transporter permease [Actinomycetota bacterium]
MSTTAVEAGPEGAPGHAQASTSGHLLVDVMAVTKRNLIRYARVPTLMIFSTIQPVMFVLLFRYVFGSAIVHPPGFPYHYVDYLM